MQLMDAYKNLFLIISAPTNGKHKLLFPNDNTNVALVTDIKTGWLKKKKTSDYYPGCPTSLLK